MFIRLGYFHNNAVYSQERGRDKIKIISRKYLLFKVAL